MRRMKAERLADLWATPDLDDLVTELIEGVQAEREEVERLNKIFDIWGLDENGKSKSFVTMSDHTDVETENTRLTEGMKELAEEWRGYNEQYVTGCATELDQLRSNT